MGELATLAGRVVSGRQRGRALGFPTANLELAAPLPESLAGAVYAARARWGAGPWRGAVASIGARPTFDEGGCWVEVHLLDFNGDLYGQVLEVELVCRLRSVQRFGSAEALIEQLNTDAIEARAALGERQGGRNRCGGECSGDHQ